MNDRLRQVLVFIFAVSQVVIGYLSNGWFDPNIGEVSDSFANYFTPAGITFAVWGYLYLAVIAYAIYQALPAQRERQVHRRIGGWVALGCAASTLWPVVFSMAGSYGAPDFQIGAIWLSVVVIALLAVALIMVVLKLRGLRDVMTTIDHWLVALPFLSYLAWASVATIANVTTLLVALGLDGDGSGPLWSAVMIIVATLIVIGVLFYSRSRVGIGGFAAVIVWALVGIYLGNNEKSALVGVTALGAAAVVAIVCIWRLVKLPPNTPPNRSESASLMA